MNRNQTMQRFRWIAIAEGISFLVLLGIAMPLKYFFHAPQAVTIVGWLHGVLFVAYIYLAFQVMAAFEWSVVWLAKAFLAGLLPFGTFVLDRQLKRVS